MRSSFDPLGSSALIIDKLIGNAYSIVEYVAKNMAHVRRASFYMKNIYDASQRLNKLIQFTGPATAGASVNVALPSVQYEDEAGNVSERVLKIVDVVGWSSTVLGSDGVLYSSDSGYWNISLRPETGFQMTLSNTALAAIYAKPVKLLIDYTLDAV